MFCPSRVASVDFDTCLACPHFRACAPDPSAPGATLSCTSPGPSPPRRPVPARRTQGLFTQLAAVCTVGEMMSARVTCLEPSVSVADAQAELERAGLEQLPVVGQTARPLGVFWRLDRLPPRLGVALARRHQRLGRAPRSAGEYMDPRITAVGESAAVTRVLGAMTSCHTRSVVVVSELDAIVGSVTDLELLEWFASARRSAALSDYGK